MIKPTERNHRDIISIAMGVILILSLATNLSQCTNEVQPIETTQKEDSLQKVVKQYQDKVEQLKKDMDSIQTQRNEIRVIYRNKIVNVETKPIDLVWAETIDNL